MISSMGSIISGRAALGAAVFGTSGVVVGVWMFWNTFCLLSCTLTEQRAGDTALAVTAVSFVLVMAAFVLGVIAVRQKIDRPWAIAALWVAGVPVVFGLIVIPLMFMVLGF